MAKDHDGEDRALLCLPKRYVPRLDQIAEPTLLGLLRNDLLGVGASIALLLRSCITITRHEGKILPEEKTRLTEFHVERCQRF